MNHLNLGNKDFAFQKSEKEKHSSELIIANKELAFQNDEKEKRAAELIIANKELAFQNEEKEKRAAELVLANNELAFQNDEKEKRAAELIIANKELAFQNEEKEKRASELAIANEELIFQNNEKEKRAAELIIANKELAFQNEEKEKRAAELVIANKELGFQNDEKEKRAAELIIANKELAFQNEEKEKRAAELVIANKELAFQNEEKEKRAAELIIANHKLVFQNAQKEKRAAELLIANKELIFQNEEKEKRTAELTLAISDLKIAEEQIIEVNKELEASSKELQHTLNDLNKIMDFSMDIICTVDEAGNFVQVSAASQAIWGYSSQELINVNYIGFVYADDVEKTAAKEIEIKNGVPITMFENHFVHKNGSIVPMLWSASWDEHDQLMYCIGKDATEKKRLEKANEIERQRFLDLYLHAPSCMGILKGPNHVYEMANPLYLQLIDRSDIIGKTVKEVLPELKGQGIFEFLDTVYTTGNTFSANEMRVQFDKKGNGELVDTYLNFIYQAHRNHDGHIDGIVFFVIDVTEQVISRHKIEESGKRYRQIAETAQEGIWLIDEYHKTTFVNSKMCEILEFSEAEMMGKDIYYFMDEEGKERAADLMELIKAGQSGQGHLKYISKSGNKVWTNLSANPLFDDKGIYKGILAMVTDITERKSAEENIISTAKSLKLALAEQVVLRQQAEDSEARLKEAQSIAHLGHWVLNLKTYLAEWSDEGCRIYGLAVEDNIHSYSDWLSFIHPEDLEFVKKSIEESPETSPETTLNFRILLKDGTVKYIASTSRIEYDEFGVPTEVYGISFDITQSKLAEIRLNNLNEDLQVQAKELAISNLELEQFAYVASHDLQEPLRMVTSFLKLLEKKYGAVIDDKGRAYIDFAVDGAKRMRQIILDLLEFSRVGRTEEKRENIDLNKLVDEVQILYRKTIQEKNALLISDPLPHVNGYRSPLLQVFQNLLGNALKYTAKDRAVRINISSTEFVDHWQFAVHDNGIGIEQEYFDKIFIIFQRLHTKDEFSGTGMGLAITKKILESQGGKIWVESEEGTGSTFYFTIQKN